MKTLIIEDEQPAARRLAKLLGEHCPECEVLEMIDSVEAAVKWLTNYPAPDLVFMDIQLADGLSFDIFTKVEVPCPVIFTTAFDHYTLRAFKVNSIDYLLKPIDPDELRSAIDKYRRLFTQPEAYNPEVIAKMVRGMMDAQSYKSRFMVRSGQNLHAVKVEDIAYFFSEDGLAFAQCTNGRKYIIEYTLDQLESALDPAVFFRMNRQVIVSAEAIQKIIPWFNSRLKVEVTPACDQNLVVSRERVGAFKSWLDR